MTTFLVKIGYGRKTKRKRLGEGKLVQLIKNTMGQYESLNATHLRGEIRNRKFFSGFWTRHAYIHTRE
jgi:hypothetical protein